MGDTASNGTEYQYLQYETHDDGQIVRILLDRPDARNAQNRGLLVELDEAFASAGGVPRDVEAIAYPDDETVANMLAEVERRTPSWTWRASDDDLRRAVEAATAWTLERYDSLDVRLEETAFARWRAYDVGER